MGTYKTTNLNNEEEEYKDLVDFNLRDSCPCDKYIDEHHKVILCAVDYAGLYYEKDYDGDILLRAVGDEEAEWYPNYCPICGRKLK